MNEEEEFLARLALGEFEAQKADRPKLVGLMRCFRKEWLANEPIDFMSDCSTATI